MYQDWTPRYDSKPEDLGTGVSEADAAAYNLVQRRELNDAFEADPGYETIRHYRNTDDRWLSWLAESQEV